MNGKTARALRNVAPNRKAYRALKRFAHADQGQNPKPLLTRNHKPKDPVKKWLAAAVPNEKGSGCPTDFIPAGAKIIIGVDMAKDGDCTMKGFYDPKTGEYHIQEVVHND